MNPPEFDFALILSGPTDLTSEVEDGLFEAGCDDATLSLQYGVLYLEFSRSADSLKEAILSAIQDVRKAGIGADVVRVDECHLVTMAEIGRRIGRSRQLVHQYITGQRGPGGFPAPACNLAHGRPLWQWCAVSYWLVQNDLLRVETWEQARVVEAINTELEMARQRECDPALAKEVLERCG